MMYFAPLTPEGATAFAAKLSVRVYGPRELVVVRGAACCGFYLLRSGRARIFQTSGDGREQFFRLLAAGDTFGEAPVVDGGPNPATVESLELSEVVTVPAVAFRRSPRATRVPGRPCSLSSLAVFVRGTG